MEHASSPRRVHLIAITGGSGSGKTWLADRLQHELGQLAGRISLDSFYRDGSHLPLVRRARRNYDHPRALDWPLFTATLDRLRHGNPVSVPHYDFEAHCRLPDRSGTWTPKPLVLLDGLLLLQRRDVRRRFSMSVFISCPAQIRLARRLRRDCAERGRSAASVRRQFREQVEPMHVRFVEPQRERVTTVLTSPVRPATVRSLAAQIRHLVEEP